MSAYFLRVFALSLLVHSASAMAHSEHGVANGFVAGMSHPVSGLDHVLAMVAVGLWGAQLGKPANWLLPVAFPAVMAGGGLLGLLNIPLPGVEIGIALSAVLLGFAVMSALRPPIAVSTGLVAVFALFHGHAHGTELPLGADGLRYSLGFVIATGLLHVCGISIGMIQCWERGRLVLRSLGALVGLGGLYFLFNSLV